MGWREMDEREGGINREEVEERGGGQRGMEREEGEECRYI